VIALTGVRMFDSYDSSSRFQGTLDRMNVIRDKILGDERIIQSGRRVDLGYFGKHAAFPPAGDGLDALSSVWKTCDPYLRSHDAWGRRFDYDGPGGVGGVITIQSPGANGVYDGTDTGFDTDISMQINTANNTANRVYIWCKDVNGTLLQGIVNGNPTTYDYPIRQVTFIENGGTAYSYTSTAGGTLTYSTSGYWYSINRNSGQCTITVYPADGDFAANCNTDRLPELLAEGLIAVEVHEVVNLRGGYTVFIVRFPGAVGKLHP
jgi:hypothetical protein